MFRSINLMSHKFSVIHLHISKNQYFLKFRFFSAIKKIILHIYFILFFENIKSNIHI